VWGDTNHTHNTQHTTHNMTPTTPHFYCDVDPEDYLATELTEGNTVLVTVSHASSLFIEDTPTYNNYGIELDRTNLINYIAHLQSLVSQLDSQDPTN